MTHFSEYTLPAQLQSTLAAMGFVTPTPVQAHTIPLALEGRDVLATAQTGSGKTGAFGIPIIAKMLGGGRGSALILTPTRELATQVGEVMTKLLGALSPIKTALLIGGDSMPLQMQQLRARPRILVGTPGRINDHLQRGSLMLHEANTLVLDEMDRMLDMGFEDQIMAILRYLPAHRQTMLFSATLPPAILKLSEKYLKNPARVEVGETNKAAAKIEQTIVRVDEDKKFAALLRELSARQGTIIIFVRTKNGADKMAQRLRQNRHEAEAIHGDLEQWQRERVLQAFRDKKYRILVATDIASRGLDISHIEHVINYDLPMQPEDYIHRIGRTARAGAEGSAVSLIAPSDALKWQEIQYLMDPNTPPDPLPPGAHEAAQRKGKRGKRGGGGGGSPAHSKPPRTAAPQRPAPAAAPAPRPAKPSPKPDSGNGSDGGGFSGLPPMV